MSNFNIFNKDIFTLKELCYFIKNNKIKCENKNELDNIAICYILFSSNNSKYREYLINIRGNKGYLIQINNKIIYLREILQNLDLEFTKLVIRIKTEPKNYDISITWNEFEEKTSISKNILMNLFSLENFSQENIDKSK
jgi:hypothetical protein